MTGKEKVLMVLKDGAWHSYRELLDAYFKYTMRIFDLRADGYVIEERPNLKNKHAMDYKLKTNLQKASESIFLGFTDSQPKTSVMWEKTSTSPSVFNKKDFKTELFELPQKFHWD